MPSEDWWKPNESPPALNYVHRVRSWTNTANYASVPKDNLPVNTYNDARYTMTQIYRDRAYNVNSTNGIINWIGTAGPQHTGSALMGYLSNALVASEFVNKVSWGENATLIKLLGKVSDAKVNLAVTLAEAGKTSDLILGKATQLFRAYGQFRRGRYQDAARTLNITPRKVHKTWLEWKYGWMPIVNDVKNAAEFFAQRHTGRPGRFTTTAALNVPFNWTRTTSYGAYGGGAPGTYTESLSGSNSVRMKGVFEIANENLSTAQQLGLTNPALVAWELVPFSFVFDWFISVGNYLGAITALQGISVKRAWRSNVVSLVYEYDQPSTTRSSGTTTYFNPAAHFSFPMYRHYARGNLAIDPLTLYPPRNWQTFDWSKLTSSLALMRAQSR